MPDPKAQHAPRFDEAHTTAWLSWLARGMQRHHQTVFLIEQLQPSWLDGRFDRALYMLGSRLAGSLFFGLAFGILWLGRELSLLRFALAAAVVGGVAVAAIELVLPASARRRLGRWGYGPLAWVLFAAAGWLGLVVAHRAVQIPSWTDRSPLADKIAVWLLLLAPLFGLFWALGAHRRSRETDVSRVEILSWSWWHAGKRALLAVPAGLAVLMLILYLRALTSNPDPTTEGGRVLSWCALMFFLILVSIVFGGLEARARDIATVPNQGIRLSLRSSLWAASTGPIVTFVLFWSLFAVARGFGLESGNRRSELVLNILLMGIAAGIVAARYYGGLAVCQHYLLRLLLRVRGALPWRCARFLDHAASLGFLQKVGGGYMFVHRYLLEHFASLEPVASSSRRRYPMHHENRRLDLAVLAAVVMTITPLHGGAQPVSVEIYTAHGEPVDFEAEPLRPHPVLFVHGHNFLSESDQDPAFRQNWIDGLCGLASFDQALRKNPQLGLEPYYLRLREQNRSIADDAREIARAVDAILARHDRGYDPTDPARSTDVRIAVIAFSKGTISTRLYLKRLQEHRAGGCAGSGELPCVTADFSPISEFVAIAPPNHGLRSFAIAKVRNSTAMAELNNGHSRLCLRLGKGLDFIENLNGHPICDTFSRERCRLCPCKKVADGARQIYPSEAPLSRPPTAPPQEGVLYLTLFAANGADEFVGGDELSDDCQGRGLAMNLAPDAVNLALPKENVGRCFATTHELTAHWPATLCQALYTVAHHRVPEAGLDCPRDADEVPEIP